MSGEGPAVNLVDGAPSRPPAGPHGVWKTAEHGTPRRTRAVRSPATTRPASIQPSSRRSRSATTATRSPTAPTTRPRSARPGSAICSAPTYGSQLAFNGTGANIVALATMLGSLPGPNHAVVCTDWAHINVDETGAPERILGHQADRLAGAGRQARARAARRARPPPGGAAPRPAGRGVDHPGDRARHALHRRRDRRALRPGAPDGMLVHIDGARIANATAALGARPRRCGRSRSTPASMRSRSADEERPARCRGRRSFSIRLAAVGSAFVRKQVTQLPSKMRFLAAQFNAILDDGLWLDLASHANDMARAVVLAYRRASTA